MIIDLAVLPECYVDTNLIETISPPHSGGYNHQKGCGTVTKIMREKLSDRFAIGIIDKDKNDVDYLKEFKLIKNSGNLFLHKHQTRHHYIIQIFPAIERMILENAAAVDINVADFHLPNDFNLLKKETKTETSKKDWRFKSLFKALISADAADFKQIERWMSYLKGNTYNANETELSNL